MWLLYYPIRTCVRVCLVIDTSFIADILRKFDNMVEVILPQLPTSFSSISDPEGKGALIWILGEYGEVRRGGGKGRRGEGRGGGGREGEEGGGKRRRGKGRGRVGKGKEKGRGRGGEGEEKGRGRGGEGEEKGRGIVGRVGRGKRSVEKREAEERK